MPEWNFNTTFTERMKDSTSLTFEDFRQMLEWLKQTHEIRPIDILNLRIATQVDHTLFETREAIEKFDRSSSKLTSWLIGMTVVLVLLTGAITVDEVPQGLKPHAMSAAARHG